MIKQIYRNNDFKGIQFVGKLLERMIKENNLIRTRFSAKELEQNGLDEAKIEVLLSLMTSIRHDGVFLLFKSYEHTDQPFLKCSLRSNNPAIDVGEMAKKFGGGGHQAAAACRVLLDGRSFPTLSQQMREVFQKSLTEIG